MRPIVWLEMTKKWSRKRQDEASIPFSRIQVPGDGVNARVHWWHETPPLLANDHTGSLLVCRAILVKNSWACS